MLKIREIGQLHKIATHLPSEGQSFPSIPSTPTPASSSTLLDVNPGGVLPANADGPSDAIVHGAPLSKAISPTGRVGAKLAGGASLTPSYLSQQHQLHHWCSVH